ncbi:unnamed protein product (mitochondrion) [Plasmodiophora brassicae]|uniref:Tyr recombinase domain-containing protein n=1 Tax=Plasmodiophora brassicae TaxID=37360 RepID=A0A3P3Y8E4_PLABS|nr:unnamed protein product [Plasmodiophora brassicae]
MNLRPRLPRTDCDADTPVNFEEMARHRAQRPRRNRPRLASAFTLTAAQEAVVARRVAEEIAKLELQVNEEDRRKHFCALIGDYKSLILLGDCIPKYAPSMLARTIVRYLDWKTGEEGSALLDVNGASVVDVDGNAVVCDGQWKNPGTLVQFLAAVSNAHKAAGMDGVAYAEPCDQCVDLYETRGSVRGCRHHAGRPVLNQCGNVRFSQDVMDAYARLSKVVLRGYVPHGDSMVSPKELMDLRNVLMGTGRIKDIRLWTMILFSVRLFLRSDETVKCRVGDFVEQLTVVDEGVVKQLAVTIKGKRDTNPVVLLIHRDDDVPEFCLLRHLLAWVSLSRTGPNRSVYLFPHAKKPDSPFPKSTFLRNAGKIVEAVTERDGPWGTHWMRKTGGLLGTWGGASDIDLQHAFRHSSMAMTSQYKADSSALLEHAKNQPDDAMIRLAPRWRPIYVENLQMCVNMNARQVDDDLVSLARRFVDDLIQQGCLRSRDRLSGRHLCAGMLKSRAAEDIQQEVDCLVSKFRDDGYSRSIDRLLSLLARKHSTLEAAGARLVPALSEDDDDDPDVDESGSDDDEVVDGVVVPAGRQVPVDGRNEPNRSAVLDPRPAKRRRVGGDDNSSRSGTTQTDASRPRTGGGRVSSASSARRTQRVFGEFDVPARLQLAADRSRPDYAGTKATLNIIREVAEAANDVPSNQFSNAFRVFYGQCANAAAAHYGGGSSQQGPLRGRVRS